MTLTEALEIHKYGGLTTWRDLFSYQNNCKDPRQVTEIGVWASRYNEGQKIVLPLKDNPQQEIQTTKTIISAEEIFNKE